jgi:hypothetical protein
MLRKRKLHNSWSVVLWSVGSGKEDERGRVKPKLSIGGQKA